MPSGFLPSTDGALLAWSLNFSTRITATPTAFGLTAAHATAYAAVHASFAAALANCDPGERTKANVIIKNQAKENLKIQARLLADLVDGTATVSAAAKTELGLNVRAQPSPIPPPALAPALEIVSVVGWSVRLRLRDAANASRRGRPVGVFGASVFSFVGPPNATPPSDLSGWQFEGSTGKTTTVINFPDTLAPGTKVYITAFWTNPRKQPGPIAPALATNLQGGTVAQAA